MTDKQPVADTYVPDDFKLNSWLLKTELSMGAKLTYSVLASCCNGKDHAWPSQSYLAKCLTISVRSVQRHLKELVDYGLIKIIKKRLMGQLRSVYVFLNHALVSFEPKTPPAKKSQAKKAGSPAPTEATKTTRSDTTKTANRGDKNGTSYNKEESYIDNNINIPPTPQKAESLIKAESLTADAASGAGEIFNSGVKEEDPAWVQAKKLLAERLSEFDLNAWIEPIVCEKGDCQAVLRMPNDFFLTHVKRTFGTELTEAFKAAGVPELRFDLLTPEQKAYLEEKAEIRAEQEARKKEAAAGAAAEAERRSQAEMENLPPENKFDLLCSAYPVTKELAEAKRVFMRLYRKGELPSMAELFRSIRDHQAKDRWWREKMPPLLGNWLSKKKWRDKPYE